MKQSISKSKIIIIGAGFSSLAASCYLAKAGYEVTVLEKNSTNGGRARQLKRDGFTFDLGPTFYWMPDVFEKFFADFNKNVSDYYELKRLDPAYTVFFEEQQSVHIGDNLEAIKATFESIEAGSSSQLAKFMSRASNNYDIAVKDLVYQPGENVMEIVTPQTVFKVGDFFNTIKGQVSRVVKNKNLQKVLEFPVLFLGAMPSKTPAFYNFMNFADFGLGTWHPTGGMYQVVEAIYSLAQELGVMVVNDSPVLDISMAGASVSSVTTPHGTIPCDLLLSGADYHHTETLLPLHYRQYSEKYWRKKTFAPSALLFYVGFDKKLSGLSHHSLFFDVDFEAHAEAIYNQKSWPEDPLFYASFPSMSDDTCAPKGKESGIFLIPLAPDLEDTPEIRATYYDKIMDRLEDLTKQNLRSHVLFTESFCVKDFKSEYNSYKGNAYGLANTLLQTHVLRPKLKSKKVDNLYFTGQLTVPGPGVPPSLISGKIVSELITKYHG